MPFERRLWQTVLGNHLHLIVEADSSAALSRGMQGLAVRIAKALNRLMQRRGRVFEDHFHSRLLRSPTQLVNAVAYVLGNHEHHYRPSAGIDPYSSLACDRARILAKPRTWLIRAGWRLARVSSPWLGHWIAVRDAGSSPDQQIANRMERNAFSAAA